MEIVHITKFTRSRIKKDSVMDAGKKICIHYYSDCSRMKSDFVDEDESLRLPNSGTEKMYFSSHEERDFYFYSKGIKVDSCSECFDKNAASEWDSRLSKSTIIEESDSPKKYPISIPQSVYTVMSLQELLLLENNQWAFLNFSQDTFSITKNKFQALENAAKQFLVDSNPKFVVEIKLKEQYFIQLVFSDHYKINDLDYSIPKREKDDFNKNIICITIAKSFYA
jgi:hypothetical protein